MTTKFYVTVTACCPVSNNCFISMFLAYPRCLHGMVALSLPLADLHNPNAAPKTVVMGKLSLLPYPTAPSASKLTLDASSCATD